MVNFATNYNNSTHKLSNQTHPSLPFFIKPTTPSSFNPFSASPSSPPSHHFFFFNSSPPCSHSSVQNHVGYSLSNETRPIYSSPHSPSSFSSRFPATGAADGGDTAVSGWWFIFFRFSCHFLVPTLFSYSFLFFYW